jgi:hypothetical protein
LLGGELGEIERRDSRDENYRGGEEKRRGHEMEERERIQVGGPHSDAYRMVTMLTITLKRATST